MHEEKKGGFEKHCTGLPSQSGTDLIIDTPSIATGIEFFGVAFTVNVTVNYFVSDSYYTYRTIRY